MPAISGHHTGLKKGAYVSRVVASASKEGTAYAAFDNHRSDDFTAYLYKTTNYGDSWTKITTGIPEEAGTIHVVREHAKTAILRFGIA